jgi:hypothetical protein
MTPLEVIVLMIYRSFLFLGTQKTNEEASMRVEREKEDDLDETN